MILRSAIIDCRKKSGQKFEAKNMNVNQLPLFIRKTFKKAEPQQLIEPKVPTGESSVMQTLPAFQAYLSEKYAPKTAKMYFGDVRELSLFLRNKTLTQIT